MMGFIVESTGRNLTILFRETPEYQHIQLSQGAFYFSRESLTVFPEGTRGTWLVDNVLGIQYSIDMSVCKPYPSPVFFI